MWPWGYRRSAGRNSCSARVPLALGGRGGEHRVCRGRPLRTEHHHLRAFRVRRDETLLHPETLRGIPGTAAGSVRSTPGAWTPTILRTGTFEPWPDPL